MPDTLEPSPTVDDDSIIVEIESIDASDLIIGETIVDSDDYDEVILLDLSAPERQDFWYS